MDLGLVLHVLSWTAMVTTITLFFTGIPICINIYKMGTTGDISGVPFLMGFLGGSFWLRYGLLKSDNTMVTVNVVASSLFFVYCVFYLCYADYKKDFGAKFVAVIATIVGMLFYVQYTPNLDVLGFLCMTFNIINFGAPLAGLGVVLKKKNTESLPLPMCFCNLLVSSQWFLYGNLVNDRYIMIPNGIGMLLAVIQLSLFIIFPRTPNGRSLFQRLCGKKSDDYANEKEPMNPENEHNTPVVDHSVISTSSDPSTIQQSSDEPQFEKTPLEDTDDQVQIIGHTATSHPNAGNTKIPIV